MSLTYDAQIMVWRLRQRLTVGELFALAFALGMVSIFTWYLPGAPFAGDFRIYLGTAHCNFCYYYYGYWLCQSS